MVTINFQDKVPFFIAGFLRFLKFKWRKGVGITPHCANFGLLGLWRDEKKMRQSKACCTFQKCAIFFVLFLDVG